MILTGISIFHNFLLIFVFRIDPLTTALTTDRKNAAPNWERRSEAYISDAERVTQGDGLLVWKTLL